MRNTKIIRNTRETDIELSIDLDGNGKADVECQEQFLQHMMETLAKYASFDLMISASGDNDHHLIEDVAIVLGMGLREAMGEDPIRRISHSVVAMDDALVMVVIDLIDRPFVDLECPDPLYTHFLRSFAMAAGMTLHSIQMRGFDEHHIVEATFKALGLCLKEALVPREELLSTKSTPKIRRE
jgi:imidazoleglycerol-phosphate dehydratase